MVFSSQKRRERCKTSSQREWGKNNVKVCASESETSFTPPKLYLYIAAEIQRVGLILIAGGWGVFEVLLVNLFFMF